MAKTGNMLGLTEEEVKTLSSVEIELKLHDAYQEMFQAGAHFVVDGITECIEVLEVIGESLKCGERP